MNNPEKMIIYNLFPLIAGKLTAWEKHFVRASDMGFNWIFVNPIQLPGMSGSIYSIADYYSMNPRLLDEKSQESGQAQVRDTLRRAEQLNLNVMIDLVINHCAVDSQLLKLHPEWFVWASKDQVVHPFAYENQKKVVWGDLALFDFGRENNQEGLFKHFFAVVSFLIDLGFKGFRCDAAYQIPRNFWERLITETRERHPEIYFFAETLGCTPEQTAATARAGFDYIFNSSKWWDFKSPWLMEQYNLTRETAPSISFPESHDTVRLCEELGGNIDGLRQRYLFAALFSAGVMMPVGFEFGFRKRLHVVKTRPEDWERTSIDLREFIRKVNELKAAHAVLQEESATEMLHNSNDDILLMRKSSNSPQEEVLLILNKNIHKGQRFHEDNLERFVHTQGTPLVDASPEHPIGHVAKPCSFDLRPGQGIVLVPATSKFPMD